MLKWFIVHRYNGVQEYVCAKDRKDAIRQLDDELGIETAIHPIEYVAETKSLPDDKKEIVLVKYGKEIKIERNNLYSKAIIGAMNNNPEISFTILNTRYRCRVEIKPFTIRCITIECFNWRDTVHNPW